jgi:hypothetical protein
VIERFLRTLESLRATRPEPVISKSDCEYFVIAVDGWSGKAVYIERYREHAPALARKSEIDEDASQDKAFVLNTDKRTLEWLGPERVIKIHNRLTELAAGFDDDPPSAA